MEISEGSRGAKSPLMEDVSCNKETPACLVFWEK